MQKSTESYRVYRDRFSGYTIVISGAANGIGRACALRFAKEGGRCLLCDINETGLAQTRQEINSVGAFADSYIFDIAKSDEARNNVQMMIAKYGRIDVLVHSVGVGYEKHFTEMTEEEWRRCIEVNLNGVVFMTQPILKNMIKNRFGKIINITSQAGKTGRALHTHYCASKFGLNGFTQALALDVAEYGINVNAVCPSRIETKMIDNLLAQRVAKTEKTYEAVKHEYIKAIPIGRLGRPEDVAALVAFLATDEASYITGQFISTSGGRL